MTTLEIIFLALGASVGALLLALIGIVLIRTALFRPKAQKSVALATKIWDKERSLDRFRTLIAIPTVSRENSLDEDPVPFVQFRAALKELYPLVHATCELEEVAPRGLLYRWKGREAGDVTVLMSHYDVVPAVGEWEHPPFSAEVIDGVVWGRGTLDTKGTLCSILEAAEQLISEGFTPLHDVYFSFGGDEEVRGLSTPNIVKLFRARKIGIAAVLDEGGAVVEGVFPGVKRAAALIGTAEKGIMDFTLTLDAKGGHASSPPAHTALTSLSKAVLQAEKKRQKMRLTSPVLELFDRLGRHSTFLYRMLFANLRLFRPLLDLYCRHAGGEINALVRTTKAFTLAEGSKAINVLPTRATMAANFRLIPGDDIEETAKATFDAIKVKGVSYAISGEIAASPASRTDTEAFEALDESIRAVWGDVIVSPYLMIACSDSRHFSLISDKVYRFSAMALSNEERGLIHAANERVPIETFYRTIAFYLEFLQKR